MSRVDWEIAWVMMAVGAASSVPGVFLVLRRMAMTTDAIGHTLILGIVVAYAIVRDLSSPWLAVGASAASVLTVYLIDALLRMPNIKQDAAIGLVFPALFALGTILASMQFRQVHLDVDAVLLGQVENSWLSRFSLSPAISVPRSFAIMVGFALLNGLFVSVFYKELKLSTFDTGLALTLGFVPALLNFLLISLVSLTAVAAFDAVGPILVVSFFVAPAATAMLISHRLWKVILLTVAIAVGVALSGTMLACRMNTNVAGTVATLLGVTYAVVSIAIRIFRVRH
ncbi:MAG: metal ABC transporter permease [Gemmataceae bacterium]